MPTPDQIRLMEDRARPRAVQLWWALQPLRSVIRFMQSGAHPDDEMSDLLAALAFRDGFSLSYVCATRGEGGQNDIGTEAGTALGALRTAEMERAADILGMRLYWLSEGPDDPITDFGFSKSGEETLDRWGEGRTLARFVEAVRTERPDLLLPTFLDVPGQHGHHRAMTRAAHRVMAAAADPAFPSNLPPWQVKKLLLPAWSGAGQAYDDAEPPPPATFMVPGAGGDAFSGWSWARIGQQSRAFHRTQGMGRWAPPGAHRDWPLHLAESHVDGAGEALAAGLPNTLADLADLPGSGAAAEPLRAADRTVAEAHAAFPDYPRVAAAARTALGCVREARDACPEAARDALWHRLQDKEIQLGHVLRLALAVEAQVHADTAFLYPGQEMAVSIELGESDAEGVAMAFDLPAGWSVADGRLTLAEDAPPTNPYPASYDPAAPAAPALVLTLPGEPGAEVRLPWRNAPVVLPPRTAAMTPSGAIVNRARPLDPVAVALAGVRPGQPETRLDPPSGWRAETTDSGARLHLPPDLTDGLTEIPLVAGTQRAEVFTVRRIAADHIRPAATFAPAVLRVRVLAAEVPDTRVGYVGAGNDRVGHWLAALGADVTDLTDADIGSDAALGRFGAIVVGIFALRFRPGLVSAMPRLNRWCAAGGTLVTLYHRPWDNWDPDTIPPRRLEIGQPSLRWRVTDETAEVRHVADHPVLTTPNRIGPEDWQGWVKERGLYFAKNWDDAYVPLLEMADPGEAPLRGAMLAAEVGDGRHVHTSLILHHQMENLVPGAFRIMANLIAPRR